MPKDPDNKRARIAEAFEKHFRHFGYKKTTVDEVAAELCVSKKTIYKVFTSKEDIFRYIISRKAEARKAMVEEEIKDLHTATSKLGAMIHINFREFRKIHSNKQITPGSFNKSEMATRIFRKTFYRLLKDIVEMGVKNGEFGSCEPTITVRYIQAMISETFACILEDPDEPYEEHLICAVQRLLEKKYETVN